MVLQSIGTALPNGQQGYIHSYRASRHAGLIGKDCFAQVIANIRAHDSIIGPRAQTRQREGKVVLVGGIGQDSTRIAVGGNKLGLVIPK